MDDHPHIAVTAIGNDRPGIVAGVARGLYELGCNLEDVSSTILRGHFSMVLVVTVPEDVTPGDVEARLQEIADPLGVVITARPVEEAEVEVPPPTHLVSVYGADQPGIVYRVADVLAAKGINITALTSRVLGSGDRPVYALLLEVASDAEFEQDLQVLRSELGVEVSVHPIDSDVL